MRVPVFQKPIFVRGGFLDAHDIGHVTGDAGHGGGQHVAAGAAGHVIQDDGHGHFGTDGLEVLVQAFLRGLVVIGGDVQGGVRPDIFGELGQRDGFAGVVGARAGDDGNAFVDLLDADADSGFMLVVGHRGGFAGGAAGHEAVDALFDLPFDEFTVSFLIDLAVLERRHQCGESSVETSGSHNNPLSVR